APERTAPDAQATFGRIQNLRFPCSYARGPTAAPLGGARPRGPRKPETLCPSLLVRAPLLPCTPNSLRQMLLLKLKPNAVAFRISEVRQAVDHPHHKEDGRVEPERNAGIAFFNLEQGCPADGGPLRGDGQGDAPPPPRVP